MINSIALDQGPQDKDDYDIAFALNHTQPSIVDLAKKVRAAFRAGSGNEARKCLRTKYRTFDSVVPMCTVRAATTSGEDRDMFQRAANEDAADLF